jgi:LuxR family maltose regulon positive regulatory protein
MPSPIFQTDGQRMLETLERATCFSFRWITSASGTVTITSLPMCCWPMPCMEWPERLPQLHGRASEWYEQHDLFSEAIRHALAAQDFERAAV